MFIRETKSSRKHGAPVKYLQLAETTWDKKKKIPATRVICNFGRIDKLNQKEIQNIAEKLLSYLKSDTLDHAKGLNVGDTKEFGILYLVENIWRKLKLDAFFKKELKKHKFEAPIERAIIGMIFNRCQEPKSKLSTYEWLKEETFFKSEKETQLQHFYRALDFLESHHEELEESLYFSLCNLFNREADLVFFDTTSTYFEIRDPEEEELRQYGHPHSHRGDRPQILIGLAVNKDGLPLASEVFPGNTADVATVKKMIGRMKRLGLERCIFVSDRGTVSKGNIEALKLADLDYIIGVKLRSTKEVREKVLLAQNDYVEVSENLKVKEVHVNDTRYVVCYNPKEERKDRETRNKWIARIESLLPSINSGKKDDKEITNHIVMKRLVKKDNDGQLILNHDKIRQEEKCDGIYVVCTSTDLPIKDVAQSYKMLQRVEQAFHYIKSFVEIRPCYHRTDIRIKAHVLLCVLAYLIERWTEIQTGLTWSAIKTAFGKIHAVELTVNKESFVHRSGLNEIASNVLNSLKIKYPKKILRKNQN